MKQRFEHYEKWEDFQSGMFSLNDIKDKHKKVFDAVELLSNKNDFYDTLKKVLIDWKIASEVNLTNKTINRRAWLGAAACMYKCKTPEYLTRVAWNLLNKETQEKANKIAEKIIYEFENPKQNGKTLFD